MSGFTEIFRATRCAPFSSKWMAMTEATSEGSFASGSSPSNPATERLAPTPTRLLLVDDDDFFRESLGLNLIDEGFAVTSFSNGADTLKFFEAGGSADVLLLDWRMPGMDGLEVLRQLRRRGLQIPVIFLTVLSDDIYEETALEGGAVDFIDKSKRLSILLKRVTLIAEGTRSNPAPGALGQGPIELGPLSLRTDISRAYWKGQEIELTLTEFNIVVLMATRAGQDVPYRDIYDLVHGKDFIAGYGAEGYRANVRTFIKRIRKKFRDLDPDFDAIGNYAGFGYRWVGQV
jgi:two-component system response regulator ChvI